MWTWGEDDSYSDSSDQLRPPGEVITCWTWSAKVTTRSRRRRPTEARKFRSCCLRFLRVFFRFHFEETKKKRKRGRSERATFLFVSSFRCGAAFQQRGRCRTGLCWEGSDPGHGAERGAMVKRCDHPGVRQLGQEMSIYRI